MLSTDRLLTAAQAAQRLKLSLPQVYARRDLRAARAPRGAVLYDLDKVEAEAAVRGRAPVPRPDPERGRVTAAVCRELEAGQSIVAIAIKLEHPLELVMDIAARYAEATGRVLLTTEQVGAMRESSPYLRGLVDRHSRPLGDALVEALKPTGTCVVCLQRDAMVCEVCRPSRAAVATPARERRP
jgi:hypothetical protein